MRTMRRAALATAALLMTGAAGDAAAQGWIEPPPRVAPGEWGVVKVRTSVHVRVVDRVAHVEVEEWFENRGGPMGEGDYLYPLPGEAAFANFSLWQGEEELRGETMDAERARSIYEEIVRRQKDPALIELVGHGLLRARVFPFAAGETRRITLRYTQVLERAGESLAFRYAAGGRTGGSVRSAEPVPVPQPMPTPRPLPVPRRGLPGPTQMQRPVAQHVPLDFELVAEAGDRFGEPFSPTHELRVRRDDARLVVRTERDLAGDLSLFLPLAEGAVGVTVVTHRPATSEDGWFMMTLSPRAAQGPTQPRDVTAVVDVSGSMAGAKLRQTQDALRQLLASLDRQDRFRLVAFSGSVRSFAPDWTAVGPASLEEARDWVDALAAEGGTNIAGALREAFAARSGEGRLPIVLFLTDGLPTVEEQDPEAIAGRAEAERGRARVFTFGIGHDVNTYLLDRLSTAGRGATEYVGPGEDVEGAVGRLAARISHPVLTELSIGGAPVQLLDVYPHELPDLFAGEELVVFGRYRADDRDRSGPLRVTGRRAGRTESYGADVVFPEHETRNDYIPRLWASRKVGALMQQIRLHGPNEELVDEVRRIALRHGILTDYTSHLVQEPGVLAQAGVDVRRLRAESAAAPPPPPMAAGADAVQASKAVAQRQQVASAAALEVAEEAAAGRLGALANSAETRLTGGRIFVRVDGVWRDGRVRDGVRTLRIRPFSDAWFELLRLLPELEPVLAEMEQVMIGGERVTLAIVEDGGERLTGDRGALVRDFRGR